MQLISRASWLATVLAAGMAFGPGCTKDDPPGIFLEFRIDSKLDGNAFRPDHLRFYWMAAGAPTLVRRLPPDGPGSVDQNQDALYRIFVELPAPLTTPRVVAAVGLRGEMVVSGGVLVLRADPQAIRHERVLIRHPLPDESPPNGHPDLIDADCLKGRPESCYPPGREPPPPPDGGATDDGPPPSDAGEDIGSEPPDAGADTPPPPPDVLPDGPSSPLLVDVIGHWKLDDAAGSMVRDSSGRNNHGTLRAANVATSWIAPGNASAKIGGAVDLPMSSGNGITVPASASIDSISKSFSVAAWTYRSASRNGFATIFSRRYNDETEEHYNLHFNSGTLRALVNTHSTQGTVTAPSAAPTGSWVHVGLTYDGQFLRLYQNGTQVAMTSYTVAIAATTTPLCLGCGQNGSSDTATDEALSGRLDDVLLWNRSLNADEMRRVFMGEHVVPGM